VILLMLWACVGVVLGYEAARHGIVQVIIPALYLGAMFVWLLVGLVLAYRASRREPRAGIAPDELRKRWEAMRKSAAPTGEPPRHEL
jgi:hypothetical protein